MKTMAYTTRCNTKLESLTRAQRRYAVKAVKKALRNERLCSTPVAFAEKLSNALHLLEGANMRLAHCTR